MIAQSFIFIVITRYRTVHVATRHVHSVCKVYVTRKTQRVCMLVRLSAAGRWLGAARRLVREPACTRLAHDMQYAS